MTDDDNTEPRWQWRSTLRTVYVIKATGYMAGSETVEYIPANVKREALRYAARQVASKWVHRAEVHAVPFDVFDREGLEHVDDTSQYLIDVREHA